MDTNRSRLYTFGRYGHTRTRDIDSVWVSCPVAFQGCGKGGMIMTVLRCLVEGGTDVSCVRAAGYSMDTHRSRLYTLGRYGHTI